MQTIRGIQGSCGAPTGTLQRPPPKLQRPCSTDRPAALIQALHSPTIASIAPSIRAPHNTRRLQSLAASTCKRASRKPYNVFRYLLCPSRALILCRFFLKVFYMPLFLLCLELPHHLVDLPLAQSLPNPPSTPHPPAGMGWY